MLRHELSGENGGGNWKNVLGGRRRRYGCANGYERQRGVGT